MRKYPEMHSIRLRGARTHNLKNINLDLPRGQLIVITGLSGSGKSSLAFDTLYAVSQQRYAESLSAYLRQFFSKIEKPDVDSIEGLSPAIAIDQKTISHNPRSTVGTMTEINDFLRLLFAKVGNPHCPKHKCALTAHPISAMVDTVIALPKETKIMILAPIVRNKKGNHLALLEKCCSQGFIKARINGEIINLDHLPTLNPYKKSTIEIVVDRVKAHQDQRLRLAESFETALRLTDGLAAIAWMDCPQHKIQTFSSKFMCANCKYTISELSPQLFSFNSPQGACPACNGLGIKEVFDPERLINFELSLAEGAIRGLGKNHFFYSELLNVAKSYPISIDLPFKILPTAIQNFILYGSDFLSTKPQQADDTSNEISDSFTGIVAYFEQRYRSTHSEFVRSELRRYLAFHPCKQCTGTRLTAITHHILIKNCSFPAMISWPVNRIKTFCKSIQFDGHKEQIAQKILKEIINRLDYLLQVGLDYISLDRRAETLSGGEAQRIRLASQLGAGLVGVLYVLDEPSIGLHARDNQRLLQTLQHLRNLGNTVIMIEHDKEAILCADYVIDMGPGAGNHGGEIVAQGTPKEIMQHPLSLTGYYLTGKKQISLPLLPHSINLKKKIGLYGASGNNLKAIDVDIPIGCITCVTGVSGSGKSTLINDTLVPIAMRLLNLQYNVPTPAPFKNICGLEALDKIVMIDQSPIGRTPRSNAATYTGLLTIIRHLFANTEEARSRGYHMSRFSFNIPGGRCEVCKGEGMIKVEMHFLADMYVMCDLCKGKRYNHQTLEILYKGKNIHEVLSMTIEQATLFLEAIPMAARKLQTLSKVGLSYLTLGQSATTLSGGEAQRIKLSKELSRKDTGQTLYVLDEPTTGLHFHDIEQLLNILHELRNKGNTIIIIEHNLDVIRTADWVIDLGPEGGEQGGKVLATGTPKMIASCAQSYTGQSLKAIEMG